MAETNLGRVQGGGFFYSSASENTVVNKSTLTPNNIPALLGDHILFENGKVYRITKVDSTSVNCVYETSIKGPQGDKGDMPDVSNKADITYVDTELDKKQDKQPRMLSNINLDDYHGADKIGNYFGGGGNNCIGKPEGYTPGSAFSLTVSRSAGSIYTQVFTYADNSSTYKREYKSNTWSEWRKFIFEQTLPNPNLLINPNFKINQRGNTSVSKSNDFIVDRWSISNGNPASSISIENDHIKMVEAGNSWLNLGQSIEKVHKAGKYILSFKVDNIDNASQVYIQYKDVNGSVKYVPFNEIRDKNNNIISKSFTISQNDINAMKQKYDFLSVGVQCKKNSTLKVYWTKLEEGSILTKFEEPEPITELAKCQRYYQKIGDTSIYAGYTNTYEQSARIGICLPVNMYKLPTITNIINKGVIRANTAVASVSEITSTENTTNGQVIVTVTFSSALAKGAPAILIGTRLSLDAEL